MITAGTLKVKRKLLLLSVMILSGIAFTALAQEPMVGEQNGLTWRGLAVGGTPAEALSRKTFYIDGMDNMSAFWSQHADLQSGSISFNEVFIGMNVGQIRDGLDSFYVDQKNFQVPIIDAILVIRLQNARLENSKVDDILKQFREATINGPDPAREKKIWREGLKLLK